MILQGIQLFFVEFRALLFSLHPTLKSASFICQYFKGLKYMSWDTALNASKAYPQIKPELWMNRNLTEIEKILSVLEEAA